MVISRSAATHAERLPIEPRPTAHTVGYREGRVVGYMYPNNIQVIIVRHGSGMDYKGPLEDRVRPRL